MDKKKLALVISTVALAIAAVTAIIVFRERIADLLSSLKKKEKDAEPAPEFTPEEIEVFADI